MSAAPAAVSNQWAVRLACGLIQHQHGSIPEAVCRYLAMRGLQALPDIIRGAGLPASQVKQALLLLMQHNFVLAYTQRDDDDDLAPVRAAKPAVVLYKLDMEAVLQVLRRPRFLLHMSEEHGPQAEELIQLLLQHGRLTFDQLVKAVSVGHDTSEEQARETVRNVLMALVNAHYVERAPPCTLRPPQHRIHPNALKTRRGSKAGSAALAAEQAQTLRGLEEMRYDHLRFKMPSDLILDALTHGSGGGEGKGEAAAGRFAGGGEEDDDDPIVVSRKRKRAPAGLEDSETESEEGEGESPEARGKRGAARGRGRGAKSAPAAKPRMKAGTKKATAAAAAEGEASLAALKARAEEEANQMVHNQDGAHEVLWRVNTEEFNRRFRHQLCVDMAKDKFDADTALVLEAMLAAGRQYETHLREERGAQLNSEEVCAHLRRIASARAQRQEQLAAAAARQAAKQAAQGDDMDVDNQDGAAASGAAGGVVRADEGDLSVLRGQGQQHEGGAGGAMDEGESLRIAELCDRVPTIINTLSSDPLEFVSYVGEGPAGSLYCVNMVRFLDNLRLKQLEASARERYGQGGLRIFRMLTFKGQLEQKQVADFAMMPAKDTRELLYRMLRQGFVFMQDIPKTSDRAASRTFYTWRADWSATAVRFGSQLYQAAGNALVRSQHELKQCQELVEMVEEAQAAGSVNFTLTAAQRLQLQRLQTSLRMLETCLMHMDESIALFNNY